MLILRLRLVSSMISVGVMVLGGEGALSQDYPNRNIRIVTSGAGGGSDFIARQIGQGISGPLGQPVIIDNRGSGLIQAEVISKAPPDGYTLLVGGSNLWIGPLMQKAPYDVSDFAPISLVTRDVYIVVVHPSLPVKSVKELIALAKARPGELNYASTVVGGPPHLAAELFKSMAGVNIVNVPYKGTAQGNTALISGEVQMRVSDVAGAAPHVKAGRLRALAVTSAEPSALVPTLPTVAASGLPGYESVGMTGMWSAGKTPAAIIARLNQEVVRLLNRADAKERFLAAGVEPVASSPEQFAAIIKSDVAKWSKVIKDAGIKVD